MSPTCTQNGAAREVQEAYNSRSSESTCSSDCDVRQRPHRAFGVMRCVRKRLSRDFQEIGVNHFQDDFALRLALCPARCMRLLVSVRDGAHAQRGSASRRARTKSGAATRLGQDTSAMIVSCSLMCRAPSSSAAKSSAVVGSGSFLPPLKLYHSLFSVHRDPDKIASSCTADFGLQPPAAPEHLEGGLICTSVPACYCRNSQRINLYARKICVLRTPPRSYGLAASAPSSTLAGEKKGVYFRWGVVLFIFAGFEA